jgi:hypothetical protein
MCIGKVLCTMLALGIGLVLAFGGRIFISPLGPHLRRWEV